MVLPGEDTFDSFVVTANTAATHWKKNWKRSYCDTIKLGDATYLNGNYTGAIGYYKLAACEATCFQATALSNWMVIVSILFVSLVAAAFVLLSVSYYRFEWVRITLAEDFMEKNR